MKTLQPDSALPLPLRLQSLLNDCREPALIADASFRLVKWNTALEALLTETEECLLDKDILYIFERLHCCTDSIGKTLSDLVGSASIEQDIFLPRSNGGSLQLSVHLHKLPDTDAVTAIVVIIRQLHIELAAAQTMHRFYKALLDTIAEGALLLKGTRGTIVTGNHTAWRLLGGDEKSFVGKDILAMNWEILREDGSQLVQKDYLAAIALRNGEPVKNRIIGLKAPEGKVTWLRMNATPLRGNDHAAPGYAVVTFSDITHEKEAEQKAKHAESVFYSFLDKSITLTWISDEEGRVYFLNELAIKTWNIDKNYKLKTIHELWPKPIADLFMQSDRYVLGLGEPLIFKGPCLRSDGSTGHFLVHKFLLDTASPKRLIAGQAIDITEEKNAQAALQNINDRFSLIVKAISEWVWDWDMETGQMYRSESVAALTGYNPEEMRNGLDWWYSKVHPHDRERVKSNVDACFRERREHWQDEYRFLCANNQYKYFADKGIIVYRDGKPVKAVGVIQNITEKKELEEKLTKQEVLKQKEFSHAIIAAQDHERNELSKELHDNVNQILTSSCLILEYACECPSGQVEEYIKKSQKYLRMAIEEIRKISKALNTSVVRDMGLRQPVEDLICNLMLGNQITITFHYDDALEQELTADTKLALYRIIQEQASNIIKHGKASKVIITIRKFGGLINLCTYDNGQGFDSTMPKKGIGLTNIKTRVEACNGTLNIQTAPGKGCFIKILIPVRSAR